MAIRSTETRTDDDDDDVDDDDEARSSGLLKQISISIVKVVKSFNFIFPTIFFCLLAILL